MSVNSACAEEAPTNSAAFPAPQFLGEPQTQGRGIERAMALLSQSTPQRRHTVKVLFYGQSTMESDWWKVVAADLKRRFPHANLIIENRALGGFASQRLVKTAEIDLYSWQPDLMIFRATGADDTYEALMRRTRERTVSDILLFTDYARTEEAMNEETDPTKIVRGPAMWNQYFNHMFLPRLAQQLNIGLLDVGKLWKVYLRETKVPPVSLLGPDKSHLGDGGNRVMATFVNAYLVPRAAKDYDPLNDERVRTLHLGRDLNWQNGKLVVPFEGNRVDVIFKPGFSAGNFTARIDDAKPSQHPELYGFTRALSTPGGKWPVILKVGSQAPLLVEEWTLQAQKDPQNEKRFTFTLRGSQTGEDGAGSSDARFVSNSGRVVIEPDDWDVEYALGLPGIKPVPEKLTVRWRVERRFEDEFAAPANPDLTVEPALTIAQGLSNEKHTLEISGAPENSLAAIRIYRPPLKAKVAAN